MAAFLTTASKYTCMHGGIVTFVTPNSRTKTKGAAVLLQSDPPYVVTSSCTKPEPKCKIAYFTSPAARSSITGSAPITEGSTGKSNDGAKEYDLMLMSNSSAASGT